MDGVGILGMMGFKVLANWAASWVAVDTYIPFTGETLTANYERIVNESLEGSGGEKPSYQGNQVLTGTTTHLIDYEVLQVFLEAVMGISAGSVVTIAEKISAATVDRYFGIEFAKGGVNNHRFHPGMVTKVTVTGEKNGFLKMTLDWAFKFYNSTAYAALTAPTAYELMKFDQGIFRVADQANAIAGGDEVHPESFEIVIDRNMKIDDYAADTTNPQQPLEPIENGFRTVEYKIKFPRYAADTFLDWRNADTPLQADITFSGSGTKSKLFEFTEARIIEGFDGNVSGAEALTLEGTMKAYRGGAHGFMYLGNEMRLTYSTA